MTLSLHQKYVIGLSKHMLSPTTENNWENYNNHGYILITVIMSSKYLFIERSCKKIC